MISHVWTIWMPESLHAKLPRDYTGELSALLALKDGQFQAHHTEMWIPGYYFESLYIF